MSHLAPCPACNRHVDVAETVCPFCAAALAGSFSAHPRPLTPARRLGRGALMAAGATLMGAAACSNAVPVPAYGGAGGVTETGRGGTNGTGGKTDTGGTTGAGGATGAGGTTGAGGATGGGGTTTQDAG